MKRKDILGIKDLNKTELNDILAFADGMRNML